MEPHIVTGDASIQGSDSWKKFRLNKIMASEIPIITGKSPYCSPHLLWKRKLGFMPEQASNWAMRRGNDLEPHVRALANEKLNMNFEPAVVIHDELDWAGASLDGIDRDNKAILEIKCVGLSTHQYAEKGEVPPIYKDQVMWQLFCSNLNTCYYASYNNDTLVIITVNRDDDYIAKELLPAAAEFYRCIIEMEEPPKGEDDFVQIIDPEFEAYAIEWLAVKESLNANIEKEKFYKEKMVSFTDDSNSMGYGVRLQRISRDGSINWKKRWKDLITKYPAADVDFPEADYRSESIGYWKASEDKNKG